MNGKDIYDALQDYLAQHSAPTWAQAEPGKAVRPGITDGKNPVQMIPRYQATIMAKRRRKRDGVF